MATLRELEAGLQRAKAGAKQKDPVQLRFAVAEEYRRLSAARQQLEKAAAEQKARAEKRQRDPAPPAKPGAKYTEADMQRERSRAEASIKDDQHRIKEQYVKKGKDNLATIKKQIADKKSQIKARWEKLEERERNVKATLEDFQRTQVSCAPTDAKSHAKRRVVLDEDDSGDAAMP